MHLGTGNSADGWSRCWCFCPAGVYSMGQVCIGCTAAACLFLIVREGHWGFCSRRCPLLYMAKRSVSVMHWYQRQRRRCGCSRTSIRRTIERMKRPVYPRRSLGYATWEQGVERWLLHRVPIISAQAGNVGLCSGFFHEKENWIISAVHAGWGLGWH